MKLLSISECESWVSKFCPGAELNFDLSAARRAGLVIGPQSLENAPASRLVFFAKSMLADRAAAGAEILVWIRETGVWESSEHVPLYDAVVRAAADRSSEPSSLPGHVLGAEENDAAVSLIVSCLLFGWGFSLYRSGARGAVHCNHDGVVWLSGDTPAKAAAFGARLR